MRPRPAHAAAACAAAGLALGPRWPLAALAAALAAPLLGRGWASRGLLSLVVLAGALAGSARMHAVQHTALGPLMGHALNERATLSLAPHLTGGLVGWKQARLDQREELWVALLDRGRVLHGPRADPDS